MTIRISTSAPPQAIAMPGGVPPEPAIQRAWTAALVLILIVMVLNVTARLIYRRFGTEIR